METAINGGDIKVPLRERLAGRFSAQDLEYEDAAGNPQTLRANDLIEEDQAAAIEAWLTRGMDNLGRVPVQGSQGRRFERPGLLIRSVMTCRAKHGVCAMCYGKNLATGKLVEIGETVGIVAAQSIGEPGTQLTLRTFHTGGVAQEDIIQGLPRVEELFEARKPKNLGYMAEIDGIVSFGEEKGQRKVIITRPGGEERAQLVPYSAQLMVDEGDSVDVGDLLVEGFLNPHDILRIKGLEHVQRYIVDQVQTVYRDQGVDINDKHIEVIVRQMLRKVRVNEAGDTNMLPGSLQDVLLFEGENDRVRTEGGVPASADNVLLGVTKASLATESFLSAASFQETTRVLTEAAINGKIDYLRGLKENVIIGKLIPAGTGMDQYRRVDVGLRGAPAYAPRREILDTDLRQAEEELAMGLGSHPLDV
jgi:DNA-directed RNA polymerase subunit beta'